MSFNHFHAFSAHFSQGSRSDIYSQPASVTLTQTQTFCATQSQQFLDDDCVFQIVSFLPLINIILFHFQAQCAVNSLPATEELKALSARVDGVKVRVLAKIRDIILELIPQLIGSIRPKSLRLTAIRTVRDRRRRSDKVEFKTARCNCSNLRPLAVKVRLLEMIFHLVYTNSYVTKRFISCPIPIMMIALETCFTNTKIFLEHKPSSIGLSLIFVPFLTLTVMC